MPIDLYYHPASAPSRAVHMVAKDLGVELNLKVLNLFEKEQLEPSFLKINPTHTVPTIDDAGFYLWESRAIMTYLANKYAKTDDLYPKCPRARAQVDRLLYFDIGTLYKAFAECYYPQLFEKKTADAEKETKLKETLTTLENFLGSESYFGGAKHNLADLDLVSTIGLLEALDFDLSGVPKLKAWLARLKSELPYYSEVNQEGLDLMKSFLPSH